MATAKPMRSLRRNPSRSVNSETNNNGRIESTSSDYSNDCETFIDLTSKHLRNLKFSNPGKFMDNFDPERSSREMRKVQRKIYTERKRKALYDDKGSLISGHRDLCDCLIKDCVGCHYPCPKCGSEKCGAECRCNRTWCYSEIEVEGTSLKYVSDIK